MKNLALLIVAVSFIKCSVKPEPLQYSKDNCSFCKMTLMDDKFGGELVTKKGKIFKFDDLKCMTIFMNSGEGKANEYVYSVTVNYAHVADEFDLIPTEGAFFLESPEVKSPMAGNVAAFQSKEDAEKFQKQWNATTLTWNELLNRFK
ncbi:MAG TPA: hypothetical protein DGG95_10350 [Cytophagales bacterium]|jgi:copper chaperone NosL|nr:hypothetical protein [Cytophagales bacterium]